MKLILWKLRYVLYMRRISGMPVKLCWQSAEASIENDPDNIFQDGPVYYAQEEMACWGD